jgi:hypothetical protein
MISTSLRSKESFSNPYRKRVKIALSQGFLSPKFTAI